VARRALCGVSAVTANGHHARGFRSRAPATHTEQHENDSHHTDCPQPCLQAPGASYSRDKDVRRYNPPMVRPERDRRSAVMLYQTSGCKSRCGMRAGAPRSRLQASGEIQPSKRSVASRRVGACPSKQEQSVGPNASESPQLREISSRTRTLDAKTIGKPCTENAYARFEGGFRSPVSQERRA
jgi:hypothetical protein